MSFAHWEEVYDQTEELDYTPNCAVSLPRYAKIVGYVEASFWGVVYTNQHWMGCAPLWTEGDRMRVATALGEAQQQIEEVLGYPLCPTWIAGTVEEEFRHDNRWVDQQALKAGRLLTRYPRIIAPGVRATELVAANAVITHGPKVGVIGPLPTSANSVEEIYVYYPESSRRIIPSRIVLSGGNVTIEVPRFRLVVPNLLNTPEGGIMYENEDAFLDFVDVRRIYNDSTTQAVLVQPGCGNSHCTRGCADCTRSACINVRDSNVGVVDLLPADYDAGTELWKPKTLCSGRWQIARLNYLAGMRFLNLEAEAAIVKLAHSKMWGAPCSCDYLVKIWEAHNAVPRVLTRERINCPFGTSEGAWAAYRWAKNLASVRMSIF